MYDTVRVTHNCPALMRPIMVVQNMYLHIRLVVDETDARADETDTHIL